MRPSTHRLYYEIPGPRLYSKSASNRKGPLPLFPWPSDSSDFFGLPLVPFGTGSPAARTAWQRGELHQVTKNPHPTASDHTKPYAYLSLHVHSGRPNQFVSAPVNALTQT